MVVVDLGAAVRTPQHVTTAAGARLDVHGVGVMDVRALVWCAAEWLDAGLVIARQWLSGGADGGKTTGSARAWRLCHESLRMWVHQGILATEARCGPKARGSWLRWQSHQLRRRDLERLGELAHGHETRGGLSGRPVAVADGRSDSRRRTAGSHGWLGRVARGPRARTPGRDYSRRRSGASTGSVR